MTGNPVEYVNFMVPEKYRLDQEGSKWPPIGKIRLI